MIIATTNWMLFTFLVAAIFILTLFPPSIRLPHTLPHSLPAKKVLIFDYILSGYVTINEGTDHILAVSKPAQAWAADGLLNHIYPPLEHIPVIGTTFTPDPEQILYLQPDVVFVRSWQVSFLNILRLPGLLEVKYDPQHPTQSRAETWKTLGETAGKVIRATGLQNRYTAKIAALQRRLPRDAARHIRVAYVHVYNGVWWTTNSNYYLAYKLELAGAQNVGKDLKFTARTDLEQLLLRDPDMILFAATPGDHTTTLRDIVCRPEFKALRAIRERRIYKLPEHTYMNEPVEDSLLLTWMTEIFYPDTMPHGLREEYKETYRDIYNYAISEDEIDKAIYLDENRNSAGYDRFARQKTGR
jgi:iron complex transport system substrate-binding protein